eukprot:TRINITY_DN15533_c0_g1_i1.p1 TRINITY_DN15533_c0_g1~~TRINITY_DN15533_c0_g1_i1.p1  ORF type:complete len:142 (+),score=41.00 TRINITY_DN15533_c0_g1_i1:254-679(+)
MINIDNPQIKDSMFYPEASLRETQLADERAARHEVHQKSLERMVKTNPNIEFHNSGFEGLPKTENEIWKEMVDKGWNRKRLVPLQVKEQANQSKDRIFGPPTSSERNWARATYLHDQEARGRDFNIITNTRESGFSITKLE